MSVNVNRPDPGRVRAVSATPNFIVVAVDDGVHVTFGDMATARRWADNIGQAIAGLEQQGVAAA